MESNNKLQIGSPQVIEPDGRQAWDRRRDESPRAFAAFAAYRDLDGDRTFERVAEKLHCTGSNIRRWAARHGWYDRCLAFDVFMDQKHREELARGRMQMRERHLRLGMAMQAIAAHALRELQDKIEQKTRLNLESAEITALMRTGAELESKALGPERQNNYTKIEVVLGDAPPDPDPEPDPTIN